MKSLDRVRFGWTKENLKQPASSRHLHATSPAIAQMGSAATICNCAVVLCTLSLFVTAGAAAEKDPNHIERVTMHVKPKLVDCMGVAPQKCMVVKENGNKRWDVFYDSIAGFKYEEGFWYELVVDKFRVPNPPADGSSIRYVLVELVNKRRDEKS
jgi:hypothetical protein